ncbi:MAG: hypothetical protein WC346_05155 [Methanogenium sp.]|jgi:hypothetical protein
MILNFRVKCATILNKLYAAELIGTPMLYRDFLRELDLQMAKHESAAFADFMLETGIVNLQKVQGTLATQYFIRPDMEFARQFVNNSN